MRLRRLVKALAILSAIVLPATAAAQAWPTKPVRVLIGFGSGGPTDVVGRVMSDHLSKALGQPFVVESRPGAAGVVAGQILVGAPADGYTLYVVSQAIIVTAKAMHADMSYDPATAFQPVMLLVTAPMALEVAAGQSPQNWNEFLPWLKANSGKLNHGSPGVGTLPHLAGELFKERIGFDSQHIPYRGSGPFSQGMMQKELQWSFDSANTALQLSKAGHVRLLAVTTAKRWDAAPDVPTLTELGMQDADWPSWFGLVVLAGTPRPIIDKLHQEISRGWRLPENIERIRALGFEPATPSPEETAAVFARDRERWTAVVRKHNIKPE